MADKYHIAELGRRLRNLVNTTGSTLIHLALLPKVTGEHKNPALNRIDKLISIEESTITEGLATIRNYVRQYHELFKDYHSLEYMKFTTPSLNVLYDEPPHTDKGNNEYGKIGEYRNFDNYFMDTVKNVLHMSQELRDGVKTLFVRAHYDIKLNLMKDLVSPDTLVIKAPAIPDVQVPFLSSVHRISLMFNHMEHPIRIDSYMQTITELYIECGFFNDYILKLIEECTYLECIHLKLQTNHEVTVSRRIADALRSRREKGLTLIKSFALNIVQPHHEEELIVILEELHFHPLETLSLYLSKNNTEVVMMAIMSLVEDKPSLQTLQITQSTLDFCTVMEMLHGKMDNITVLSLPGCRDHSINQYVVDELLSSSSIRIFNARVYSKSEQLLTHFARNQKRDNILNDTPTLMNLLPNTTTNQSPDVYSRIVQMDGAKDYKQRSIIGVLYDADDNDDSDAPNHDSSRYIDQIRRQEVMTEIANYYYDAQECEEGVQDSSEVEEDDDELIDGYYSDHLNNDYSDEESEELEDDVD